VRRRRQWLSSGWIKQWHLLLHHVRLRGVASAGLCGGVAWLHSVDRVGHRDDQQSIVAAIVVIYVRERSEFVVGLRLHAARYAGCHDVVRAIQARGDAAAHAARQAVDALHTAVDALQNPSTANQALVAAIVLQLPLHLEVLPCAEDGTRKTHVHLEAEAEVRARASPTAARRAHLSLAASVPGHVLVQRFVTQVECATFFAKNGGEAAKRVAAARAAHTSLPFSRKVGVLLGSVRVRDYNCSLCCRHDSTVVRKPLKSVRDWDDGGWVIGLKRGPCISLSWYIV